MKESFDKYIPDFEYEVIRIRDYSNEELVGFGNEMSLIMLINKLQDSEDFKSLNGIPKEYFEKLEQKTPEYLLNLISSVVAALMHRINVPREEIAEFTDQIMERRFTMLFDSFKPYDVQETRRVSRAEGKAEAILDLLEEYGSIPDQLRLIIMDQDDLTILKPWLKLAVNATSVEDFEKKVGLLP